MPGSTAYPGALDNFETNESGTDPTRLVGLDVDNHAAALNAMQAELGTDPAGSEVTVKARLEAIEADYALESQTPSLDELFASIWDPRTLVTIGGSACIFIARFPVLITSAAFTVWEGANPPTALVAASDTVYWTFTLRRVRGTAAGVTITNIATKTTKASSGGAIYRRVPWTFDDQTFVTADATLQVGDQVDMSWIGTGTPAAPQNLNHTIGYQPV